MTTPASPTLGTGVNPTEHDKFVLRQKLTFAINRYFFHLQDAEGKEDVSKPVAFVEQKRFKFKEDIRFFTDDTKSAELMRIKAKQRFDPRAKYDVTDAQGQKIGMIQKVFGKSLFRSTYNVFDAYDNVVFMARERSLLVALFRRVVQAIPYVGDFADWLPIAYHFDFFREDELVGTNTRKFGSFKDIYFIDMSHDEQRSIDRRLVLAITVGQDALQAR